jgi:hypothetical protein
MINKFNSLFSKPHVKIADIQPDSRISGGEKKVRLKNIAIGYNTMY